MLNGPRRDFRCDTAKFDTLHCASDKLDICIDNSYACNNKTGVESKMVNAGSTRPHASVNSETYASHFSFPMWKGFSWTQAEGPRSTDWHAAADDAGLLDAAWL
jgi:hypothetical protein